MYSPEIKPEKVAALYQLKLRTGKRMTALVDEAIGEYLAKQSEKGVVAEESKHYQSKNSEKEKPAGNIA